MTDIIQSRRTVYVAWTNTDLTEGRGYSFPLCVAESKETAERLGRGKYVMGGDCPITQETAYLIDGKLVGPFRLIFESAGDKVLRQQREAHEAALEKARIAGLTDEDIKALQGRN